MPDRDIFSRHVEQGWQRFARGVLGGDLDDQEISSGLRMLAREVKRSGCPRLDDISELISNLPHPLVWDEEVDNQFFDIAHTDNHQSTHLALHGARRLVAQNSELIGLHAGEGGVTTQRIRQRIGEEFLLETLRSKTVKACLLKDRSARYGLIYEEQLAQADMSIEQIRNDPGFPTLVHQLAADPSGALLSQPNNVEPEADQDALLAMSVEME